ncbi:uncharacterized protein F4822DRAFT_304802 [Hypoxylon trugodes]|uniref:uncharacterized protein n=1 Tax=Hypoxylon trugodes TaxID=326681 RepID=UPI00219FB6C0|nr:uncharacterized protein F4822DRAFT_304802 [Hypoxylon trugodes]KAI1386073.1 hypothetical protein F4822DRAFT_304802 [Hypoxylon trugodes]
MPPPLSPPPPLSSPTQSSLNRQRDNPARSSYASDKLPNNSRLNPFEDDDRLPHSEQDRIARQASEARLRQEYHRVKEEIQARRARERDRTGEVDHRGERTREFREGEDREQSELLHRKSLGEERRQPQPEQSRAEVDQPESADAGGIAKLIRRVRDRFPDSPQIARKFAAMANSGRPVSEILPGVATLFRTARDLYDEYQASMDPTDHSQFELLPSYSLPVPQPSPQPYAQQYQQHIPEQPLPYFEQYPQTIPQQHTHLNQHLQPTLPFGGISPSPYYYGEIEDNAGYEFDRNAGSYWPDPEPERTEESKKQMQRLLKLPEIDIPREQRKPTPAAMSCMLMEHQRVALTWLMQQEEDDHKKGGILADTMGLGKTIEALALILARPSRDRTQKTTLIIAPLSLLKQWEQEIQTKVKPSHKLKTIVLHNQAKRGMTVARLLTYDVVLTTYGTIRWENKAQKGNANKLILSKEAVFHRVILDEAHNIKNRFSKTSVAACQIKATYRLCMTGTPFMNRAEEIFSLIRFLGIKPYNNWEKFRWEINRPMQNWSNANAQDAAMRKLQALFRSITLRRTKTSILDGRPILRLPNLVREESMTEFNKDQQDFYDALEQKQQLKVNEFIKAGTIMKKYSYILVLLLRLRQACCHPHLIKDFGIPDGTQLSSDEMRKLAQKLKKEVVGRLKEQTEFECPLCNETTSNPLIIYPCGHPICATCFSAGMEDMRASNIEDREPCPHQPCRSEIDPEKVICYCYFMEVHMPDNLDSDAGEDDDGFESLSDSDDEDADARGNLKGFIVSDTKEEDDSDSSDTKGRVFEKIKCKRSPVSMRDESKDTILKEEEDSDSDSLASLEEIWKQVDLMKTIGKDQPKGSIKHESTPKPTPDVEGDEKKPPLTKGKRKRLSGNNSTTPKKKRKRNNGAGKKGRKGKKFMSLAALKKASSSNSTAKAKYLKRLRQDWVPSAKINKTMEILHAIREKNPQEKTLVFSLWTSFLDLLEIPIHDAGFGYARYDGSMDQNDRDMAVKDFTKKPDTQILLISLSAGNAGLNLTAATQVIILEPFWNPFVEEQAIDRAHRIGQRSEVTVHRILIENTVEDRIRALQEKKRELVTAALSEEGAQGVSRLTVSELRGLFGLR